MKLAIVKIGNSRGVRIPKAVMEQCGFADEVEMEIKRGVLLLRAPHTAREGWEEAFKRMAEQGDDMLEDIHGGVESEWDEEEWEWK